MGVYHLLKGPEDNLKFFILFMGGVFLECQKTRFFTLTACIFFWHHTMCQQCTPQWIGTSPIAALNLTKTVGANFLHHRVFGNMLTFSQYGGTSEKIYFRENVVVTKNLPPYFPISLVRNQIQFFFFFFASFLLQRLKNSFNPFFSIFWYKFSPF